jgi:hypothetical protein
LVHVLEICSTKAGRLAWTWRHAWSAGWLAASAQGMWVPWAG